MDYDTPAWTVKLIDQLLQYWNVEKLSVREIGERPGFFEFSERAISHKIFRLQQARRAVRHRQGGHNGPWHQELIELVQILWDEGMSAGAIAARPEFVAAKVSRNAVIGMVHRLRAKGKALPARQPTTVCDYPTEERRANGQRAAAARLGRHPRPRAPRPPRQPIAVRRAATVALREQAIAAGPPGTTPVGFFEHRDDCCRFICSGTGLEALWCAAPKTRGSYCTYHAAICTHRSA
jgi:hypothetical protein